jgi:tRNA-2-methylthio-N6-dimethylallyladenosine synthase
MYSFKYSSRPGTLAGQRMPDDVTEAEKTRRIVALQRLQGDIQSALFAGMAGQTVAVLVDGVSRRREWEVTGRTSGNTPINLPGGSHLIGQTIDVRITGHGPNSLRGEAVAIATEEPAHAG